MPTAVCLVALALALASCTIETRYVPRTPHRLALGMRNGEAGFYLDGKFIRLSEADVALAACSPAASAALTQAVLHESGHRINVILTNVFYAAGYGVYALVGGGYFLAVLGIGVIFAAHADGEREQSYADAVDAINRYNDDPRCAP
ncbi:MAG TPA: hypothetical protein VLM79_36355 [Kofleriaceae bacterium]|nr:hypothetical protein [Kofleriaceae bacterium]